MGSASFLHSQSSHQTKSVTKPRSWKIQLLFWQNTDLTFSSVPRRHMKLKSERQTCYRTQHRPTPHTFICLNMKFKKAWNTHTERLASSNSLSESSLKKLNYPLQHRRINQEEISPKAHQPTNYWKDRDRLHRSCILSTQPTVWISRTETSHNRNSVKVKLDREAELLTGHFF